MICAATDLRIRSLWYITVATVMLMCNREGLLCKAPVGLYGLCTMGMMMRTDQSLMIASNVARAGSSGQIHHVYLACNKFDESL